MIATVVMMDIATQHKTWLSSCGPGTRYVRYTNAHHYEVHTVVFSISRIRERIPVLVCAVVHKLVRGQAEMRALEPESKVQTTGLGDGWPRRPTCARENKRESERGAGRCMRQHRPLHSAANGSLPGAADVWNDIKRTPRRKPCSALTESLLYHESSVNPHFVTTHGVTHFYHSSHVNRISRRWHYWHSGIDSSLLWELTCTLQGV